MRGLIFGDRGELALGYFFAEMGHGHISERGGRDRHPGKYYLMVLQVEVTQNPNLSLGQEALLLYCP